MSKNIIWGMVVGAFILLATGAIFNYVTTNNTPDTPTTVINDIHEALTPASHNPSY